MDQNLPRDASASPVPLFPAVPALEETYDTTISASTEITLNASTTMIRIVAGGEAVMLKWGTSDASTSDFDQVIPDGAIVDLVIPVDSTTGIIYTAINVIERTTTAWVVVLEY